MGNKVYRTEVLKPKACDYCKHSGRRKDKLNTISRSARNGHPACLKAALGKLDLPVPSTYEHLDQLSYDILNETFQRGTKTALSLAAKNGHHECVEILSMAGANVNFPYKSPPILEATKNGHAKCIDVLFEGGANVDVQSTTVNDLIKLAMEEDQVICAEVLTNTGAELDAEISTAEAAVFCAVANSYVPCLIALVSGGISVNLGSTSYVTPLMVAAAAGSRGLTCLKMLLTLGANVNEVNKYGMNALNLCIANGKDTTRDIDKCMFLLAAGERIALDDDGDSFTCSGHKYNIPKYLKITEQKLCLKHLCRQTIREYLIDIRPYSHLFGRIPELRLPSVIKRYLLYEMSLD